MSTPPSKHQHVMIDVEGMGDALMSIGAVPFSLHPERCELAPEAEWFHERTTIQANLDRGLEIDARTIEWWLSQPKEAQASLLREPRHNDLAGMMQAFLDWIDRTPTITSRGKLAIWAKPPSYDCAMLERAFKACDMDTGTMFYVQTRDARSMLHLAKELDVKKVFELEPVVKHDAMYDAAWQAEQLVVLHRHLFELTERRRVVITRGQF